MISNSGHLSIPSDVNYGYNEYTLNGWKLGNASRYHYINLNVELTLPFKVSFTINGQNGNNPSFSFGGKYVEFYNNKISINGSSFNHNIQIGDEYSIIFGLNKIEVYHEDTYLNGNSLSVPQTNPLQLSSGANRYMILKDLKIKSF